MQSDESKDERIGGSLLEMICRKKPQETEKTWFWGSRGQVQDNSEAVSYGVSFQGDWERRQRDGQFRTLLELVLNLRQWKWQGFHKQMSGRWAKFLVWTEEDWSGAKRGDHNESEQEPFAHYRRIKYFATALLHYMFRKILWKVFYNLRKTSMGVYNIFLFLYKGSSNYRVFYSIVFSL